MSENNLERCTGIGYCRYKCPSSKCLWRPPVECEHSIAKKVVTEQKGFCSFRGQCVYFRAGGRCTKVEGGGECPHYEHPIELRNSEQAGVTPLETDAKVPNHKKAIYDMKASIGRLIARVERLEKRSKKLECGKEMREIADAEIALATRHHMMGMISFEDYKRQLDLWVTARRGE